MGALALFKPARPITARATLASAIRDAEDAEGASLAAREAWARGNRQIDECEERVTQAVETVAAAKVAHATHLASAATQGAPLTNDRGTRDARLAEQDAIDELDAARLALVELDRDADTAKARAVEAKTKGLKLAAAGVVALEIDPTISRAIALRSQLETIIVSLNQECAKLSFFVDKCSTKYGSSAPSEKIEEMRSILSSTRQFADQKIRGPVYESWYRALSSLETDPDHPLPV